MMFGSEQPVEIVVIADRSGSMQSIAADAIGGFNTFLKDQQDQPGRANFTLVLFDNEFLVPIDHKPLNEVEPLTDKTFVPRGSTALNDAIGRTLTELKMANPKKAVIAILTDGQENASTRYKTTEIKRMIEEAQGRGWQVHYLAANQDAFAVGADYGVLRAHTVGYAATGQGVRGAYFTASNCVTSYRNDTDDVTSKLNQ
jgi:Mg-chelatase subunit ChlD